MTIKVCLAGAMLTIEKVGTFIGLKRGLDTVMDFN